MMRSVNIFGTSDKRGRMETSQNPYLPPQGLKVALCKDCHAVYRNKGWHEDARSYVWLKGDPETTRMTCPACQKLQDNAPGGILTLQGDYLWEHEQEIRAILSKRERNARNKNPLQRIMHIERTGDRLVIATTDNKLAEQLGRALQHSHRGELKINWGDQHHACRVNWQRLD